MIFLDRLEQKVETDKNKRPQKEKENLKKENSGIKSRLTTIEKINAIQNPYSGSKPQSIDENNEDIQNYTHRIHDTQEHKIQMLTKEITTLVSHQIIEYDKVLLNDGNGYDVRHGHFTTPVKGVYLLSVIVYTDIWLKMVNSSQVCTPMRCTVKSSMKKYRTDEHSTTVMSGTIDHNYGANSRKVEIQKLRHRADKQSNDNIVATQPTCQNVDEQHLV
ncbi:unnamed protein product [Mytilus edulis]|uniref:C1q domain-containing protein n=1 Tax=Mytilus edulis TaxID=6550 RepID=A0A8S3VS79_MYTED|nr:unnamed protein product [Mytilus edulis]